MPPYSRREFLALSLAIGSDFMQGAEPTPIGVNLHQHLLDLAAKQRAQRVAQFAAVQTKADVERLQKTLRDQFLALLDGLPEKTGVPPVRKLGQIDADDYVIEKLALESFPGYFVSALLYKPRKLNGAVPGILSPCGHSTTGKAGTTYQILHVNLAKRGFVVLTYDPVGQGERSQFWDTDKGRSRFNLSCGEHCVLGNPLYLLGTSLARYRIWDGMRALDYLTSLPEVDAKKIGCVGNSGGGTLTSYIAALDPRVQVPVIGCYITTLPRRMGNRIEADPDSDPEQDIFGFVSGGIDHAGLLALLAPRPALLATAKLDFFPIEGARESFAEALNIYEAAGAKGRIEKVEADAKHGLSPTLRVATYAWFERWLAGRDPGKAEEIAVTPRPAKELQVCPEGQVNVSLKSRPLLPLAREQFEQRRQSPRVKLSELLRLEPDAARYHVTEVTPLNKADQSLLLCVNGIESNDWQEEKDFLRAIPAAGWAVSVVDPRGVGQLRPVLQVRGHSYADPLCGVEENLAYNAFLVGTSLVSLRVADVLAAVKRLTSPTKPRRIVLCGRRDAALVACLAAALEPGIQQVALEGMWLSYWPLFEAEGRAINAASIVPSMLRDYSDIPDLLAAIGPRKVLVSAPRDKTKRTLPHVLVTDQSFSQDPKQFLDWLKG